MDAHRFKKFPTLHRNTAQGWLEGKNLIDLISVFLIFCAVCSLRSVVSELWFHVFSMWLLCVCVCDWFVTCCLCVTCTCDFYLIYLCVCVVIQKSVISPTCFSVRFAILSMWIIIIAYVFKCVCLCVFLRYVQIVSICSMQFLCVCVRWIVSSSIPYLSHKCLFHLTPLSCLIFW